MTVELVNEIKSLTEKYHAKEATLMPALYLAQKEFGWLSPEALELVADSLCIPKATVKGVATFYDMFRNRPMGRHLIQLCTNVTCMLMGAEHLVDILKEKYGLEPNGTTPDNRFSLVTMECIGACGTAPAMLVDTDFYDNLTEERVVTVLESYK